MTGSAGSGTGVTVSVTFSVIDAKTSQDITSTASGLTITLDGSAYDCGKGECDGPADVEEGSYSVAVAASGYITFSDTIPVIQLPVRLSHCAHHTDSRGLGSQVLPNNAANTRHIDFYLVPDPAGKSRMVLRWGETPADLDFYVIPKQTNSVVLWTTHGYTDYDNDVCCVSPQLYLSGMPVLDCAKPSRAHFSRTR